MTGSGKTTIAKKTVSKTNKPAITARHIVGIGASAGGLEALEILVESIPENDYLSFVIIQHLDLTKKIDLYGLNK